MKDVFRIAFNHEFYYVKDVKITNWKNVIDSEVKQWKHCNVPKKSYSSLGYFMVSTKAATRDVL